MEGRLEYMKLLYEASNFTIQARWVIPFAILGIIGVLLLLCSRKPFFKLLAAVCLVICAIAALRFCFGYVQVIQAYKQGNYKSVEGYVENFIPASSGGEDQEDMEEESFDIKGVHFSYGEEADLYAPIVDEPSQLVGFVKPQSIMIPRSKDKRIINVLFKTKWDLEMGIGIQLVNERIEIVGVQSDVL